MFMVVNCLLEIKVFVWATNFHEFIILEVLILEMETLHIHESGVTKIAQPLQKNYSAK